MDYIQIGYTKKTHGVAGEIKVVIEAPFEDTFLEKDRVFLEIRGNKQPFFIANVRGSGDLIVHFEDVNTREDALLLQSRPVFLPATELPEVLESTGPELAYAAVLGYILVDKTAGTIGRVEEILDMPQQEMALTHYHGREILVPLNPHFVLAVDATKKEVLVDLPEGLLTL